jgi:S1-C subfamily serine protease
MKSVRQFLRVFPLTLAALFSVAISSRAQTVEWTPTLPFQTPTTPQPPSEKAQQKKVPRRVSPPARVTVMRSEVEVAPQVVTIVHRLSGLQMLRMLLRQGQRGTVSAMDPQALTNNAHATIIAGWILPDGKTIAARLPQAAAEIEAFDFQYSPEALKAGTPEAAEAAVARAAIAVTKIEPDVTVITREGRRFRARYIGLDGQTGLSILQVNGLDAQYADEPPPVKFTVGEEVELFAPEPASPSGEPMPNVTYVRVAKTNAKVVKLPRTKSRTLDRLTLRAPKLSSDVVGGVVFDNSGNSLGIVDRIDGTDAQVLTTDAIREASRRVLQRQTNVPKPLLGVRGEPIEFTTPNDFLTNGWTEAQMKDFMKQEVGILLTSVLPGTPAAFANLRPGDVIIKVNDDDVKTAEEFTAQLTKCGSGEQVKLLVRRPTSATPVPVQVKLGGSFEPSFDIHFEMPKISTPRTAFQKFGLETMALSRKSALELGAQGGLVVVSVKPKSAAERAGLKEGDVIESIDGRTIHAGTFWNQSTLDKQKKHIVYVVRDRAKKQLVLESVDD